jgi:hypothetical protein
LEPRWRALLCRRRGTRRLGRGHKRRRRYCQSDDSDAPNQLFLFVSSVDHYPRYCFFFCIKTFSELEEHLVGRKIAHKCAVKTFSIIKQVQIGIYISPFFMVSNSSAECCFSSAVALLRNHHCLVLTKRYSYQTSTHFYQVGVLDIVFLKRDNGSSQQTKSVAFQKRSFPALCVFSSTPQ